MKLINEKGKLFGIINVVDLAVLLIVVVAALAVVFKMTGGDIKTPVAVQQKKVTVTLVSTMKKDYMLTAFKEGDQLMYGKLFIPDAYIEEVELTPYIANVTLPTGEIVPTPDPVYKDIIIKFTAKAEEGASVLKIGNSEIRVGATYVICTQNAQSACYVTAIEYE
jgi:hypothetical protein